MDLKYLKKFTSVIGCDEVGRGPIAGPVNACAVKIDTALLIKKLKSLNVTDSKKLTAKKREKILKTLNINISKIRLNKVYKNNSLGDDFSFCVTELSPKKIDDINILQASLLAMKKASDKLIETDSIVLIDGNKTFETEVDCVAVVKGDSKVIAIGLASIVAKVFRDEKMMTYDSLYPGYNLKQNAGYPTREHKDAVKKLGVTPIHRKSFRGVKEYL